MSPATAKPSTKPSGGSASYPHTDLAAPYRIVVTNVKAVSLGDSVVVAGDVVHPELGIIGNVHNLGDGSGTKFQPTDRTRFSIDDMQVFAERSTEHGGRWAVDSLPSKV